VTENGSVKVLDFGLAKQIEAPRAEKASAASPMLTSDTIEGQVLGTPAYMSPEQVRDEPLGPASDLFALGTVAYECLTGHAPFAGKNQLDVLASVLHVVPPPPSAHNRNVPPRVDGIVMKLLAKDRAARYRTAEELVDDLRKTKSSLSAAQTEETMVLPPSAARTPHLSAATFAGILSRTFTTLVPLNRSRLAVAVAAVLLAASALWIFLPGGSYQPAPGAVRWYQEGISALRDGTYYKASQALERAVTRDPNFSIAHARLAEAWLELEYGDKAREEMLRAVPPGSKPRLARAEQDYEQAIGATLTGDLAGAITKYREIVDRAAEADKPYAWLDLGHAYERAEDAKNALAAYQSAAKLLPQNPAVELRLGTQYARQFDQTRAAQAFHDAESIYRGLSNFEGVAEVQYQTGVLANRVGKPQESRALLDQALEMSQHIGSVSQQILVLIQLSSVDQHANNMQQAEADAARAIELARTNGLETLTMRGLIDLGSAYFAKGDFEAARKHYAQSLEYARRYHAGRAEARALLSLGSLEVQRGELDWGLPHVRQALDWYQKHAFQKESIQALTLMARAQRQKGDFPGALASFQQQLDLSKKLGLEPQVSMSAQGIGGVLMSQGRWPEALASYREEYEAAGRAGADFNLQYSMMDLATVLWRLGRYREAEQFLDRVGEKSTRAVALEAGRIRAEMALSRRDFTAAAERCRSILAESGLSSDMAVDARLALGRARLASGSRPDGSAAIAEAAALALKSGNARLIAESRLAQAEASVSAGDGSKCLEDAQAARQFFAQAGNLEREWHCWLAAGRASRDYVPKAAETIAQLQQKWDSDNYASYRKRPDIQSELAQLEKLLGRKLP
jgi:tetratricopeptide (TPR) repeat protein